MSIMQVRKTMCRIKQVLTERALADPDPFRCFQMKMLINQLWNLPTSLLCLGCFILALESKQKEKVEWEKDRETEGGRGENVDTLVKDETGAFVLIYSASILNSQSLWCTFGVFSVSRWSNWRSFQCVNVVWKFSSFEVSHPTPTPPPQKKKIPKEEGKKRKKERKRERCVICCTLALEFGIPSITKYVLWIYMI